MRYTVFFLAFSILWGCHSDQVFSGKETGYITFQESDQSVALVSRGAASPVWIGQGEDQGVIMALENLRSDIERVSGIKPKGMLLEEVPAMDQEEGSEILLAGTIGINPLIDRLIEDELLDVTMVEGKWEASLTTVVHDPFPGVSKALVIAGSDRRGTIYGIYECSAQIGVSPWYWWADVVPAHREEIHAIPVSWLLDEPAVKYRGIFINDEAPALAGWVQENFGSFNHEFYEHVFELILRMKGNYLWPAMWGRAFYDDDPLNAPLADACGVVIGTTHHEPLMRAHVEWARYGSGPWDYTKNQDTIRAFWREGIRRMGENESIVSLGMRGDGDEPMTEGTAISLLENIVADQRSIIEEVTGKNAAETPQLWALYKEVQAYYDNGMRVPDDVTLLLCDDNWGNLRKLPDLPDPVRKGGYGIYYHFDYVGGPRNYKWLNTIQIERVWEQMELAHRYGANQIWIVNVGDIKPMEFPIQYFLDMAWDPDRFNGENLSGYYDSWAAQQFGPEHAAEIGNLLKMYTKYNARRKPELLSPDTYSLIHFREAERIVEEYIALDMEALTLFEKIPTELRDAYYQLVLFPIEACANLNELYVAAAKNRLYGAQGRASTNLMAEKVRGLFRADADLTHIYHHAISGGKWNHMMSQTHIGYTYWQQPEQNNMPELIQIKVPDEAGLGMAIEGSESSWPGPDPLPVLPVFEAAGNQEYYVDVFNRGSESFECTISPSEPWIIPAMTRFTVDSDRRIPFRVDWEQVPRGIREAPVEVTGGGQSLTLLVQVDNRELDVAGLPEGTFLESGGFVSMEASHFRQATGSGNISWKVVPNLGRTHSSVITTPVTAGPNQPGKNSPRLEYSFYIRDTGTVVITTYLSPTLNFHQTEGLRFALSLDKETPQTVNMHDPDHPGLWNRWVADNIIKKSIELRIHQPGFHSLNFWRIDPGVVLQKIVIQTREPAASSYLGPPESKRINPSPPSLH